MNYAKQLENVTRERTIKPSVFNQENSYSLRAITGQGVIVGFYCPMGGKALKFTTLSNK